MALRDLFVISLCNALRQPLRSSLAALSITLGIGTLITITAGERSWDQALNRWYDGRGVDVVHVFSSRSARPITLPKTEDDTRRFLLACPSVSFATPIATGGWGELPVKGAQPGTDWCGVRGFLPGFERVFGIRIVRGRFFTETDEGRRAPVCILDAAAEKLLFGKRDMLDRDIRVGGHKLRVIGIASHLSRGGAAGPPVGMGGELYEESVERRLTLQFGVIVPLSTARHTFGFGIASLAARAENHAVAIPEIGRYFGRDPYAKDMDRWLFSLADQKATAVHARQRVRLFIGIAAMLVLFASGMGLAGVMYVAVNQRQREIGIHRAAGATSRAMAGTFLLESLWLGGVGGLTGPALGFFGSRYLGTVAFPRGSIDDPDPLTAAISRLPDMHVSLEWQAVVVATTVALAITALAGLLPAHEAAHLDPSQAIRSNPLARHHLRQVLTGLQLAAGIAAVLLLSSMHEGIALEQIGYMTSYSQADTVTTDLTITRSSAQMPPIAQPMKDLVRDPAQVAAIARECQAFASIEGEAGIESYPVKYGRYALSGTALTGVTAGYSQAEGLRLLEGRFFTPDEVARGARVVVLTDQATAVLQMDRAAGETVRIGGLSFRVLGVVREGAQYMSSSGIVPVSAVPREWTAGYPWTGSRLRAHLRPDSSWLTAQHQLLAALAKHLPKQTMQHLNLHGNIPDRYHLSGLRRAAAIRASVIGFSALLIALIGLVNMLLVSVSEQTREIGLRRALGATRSAVARAVVWEALVICLPGCVVGLGLGIAAARFVGDWAHLSTAVPAFWIVVSVGVALLGGLLASLLPATRAALLHPVAALRTE